MVLFLLHVRASIVIAITLPMAVLMSFIAMKVFGVDANIMSLAGIAIAIGTMVDMGIIILENIYAALADWETEGAPGGQKRRLEIIRESASEVVPAVMTAVSTTVVSFLPVFFLTGRDYKLFAPLAWTKTFALTASLIVAVAVVPMLCRVFLRTSRMPRWAGVRRWSWHVTPGRRSHMVCLGRPHRRVDLAQPGLGDRRCGGDRFWRGLLDDARKDSFRWRKTRPADLCGGSMRRGCDLPSVAKLFMLSFPLIVFVLGLGAWIGLPTVLRPVESVFSTLGADLNDVPGYVQAKHLFTGLKSDDWIALDEGTWFYMPSLYPAASFNQSMEVLQTQDAMIKQIPEVANVLGKIGRANSALDPAPTGMVETYVMLKPRNQWRPGMTERDDLGRNQRRRDVARCDARFAAATDRRPSGDVAGRHQGVDGRANLRR